MAAKRKGISKATRFEVFKRDKFACQYCGRSAPDVVLQVDHVHPVSKGGEENLLNYVTSCRDCNAGKSDRELSDDTAIKKQKHLLDELQERREQLDMMLQWQRGLLNLDEEQVQGAADLWAELAPGYYLNERGLADLRKWVRRFSLSDVLEAMRIAADHYLDVPIGQEKATAESIENAWKRVGGICANRKTEREDPGLAKMYHAKNILRKHCHYCDDRDAMTLMQAALELGMEPERLVSLAGSHRSYWEWRDSLQAWIDSKK